MLDRVLSRIINKISPINYCGYYPIALINHEASKDNRIVTSYILLCYLVHEIRKKPVAKQIKTYLSNCQWFYNFLNKLFPSTTTEVPRHIAQKQNWIIKKWAFSNSTSQASKMILAIQKKKNFWNPLRETWNDSIYPLR